jgi:ubiquinone/menaquinone biosynthesis C-methylase UbiE
MKSPDADPHFPPRPTALAQQFLRAVIQPGDLVIDATAGNGHDTLFLAECVGAGGRVLAFDVQEAAVASARQRIEAAGLAGRAAFFRESHERMGAHADDGSVAAIMFNLGYLPGEQHDLTTEAEATLRALEVAARILKPGGVLTVVCYPGHAAGEVEAVAVEQWMKSKGWRVAKYGAIGTRKPAPFLLVARKDPLKACASS